MESYREQAIQLPGIGKGVGVPGNAMNTEALTDDCLQVKKRREQNVLPSLSSSACSETDIKQLVLRRQPVLRLRKIQPASSNAHRKFRKRVLLALNLKYAHNLSHEFSVPNEWEARLQHLCQYCSCEIRHADVLLVNFQQNAGGQIFAASCPWLQQRVGCAGAIPGQAPGTSHLKSNRCPWPRGVCQERPGRHSARWRHQTWGESSRSGWGAGTLWRRAAGRCNDILSTSSPTISNKTFSSGRFILVEKLSILEDLSFSEL